MSVRTYGGYLQNRILGGGSNSACLPGQFASEGAAIWYQALFPSPQMAKLEQLYYSDGLHDAGHPEAKKNAHQVVGALSNTHINHSNTAISTN
jgi:hypothetical protein